MQFIQTPMREFWHLGLVLNSCQTGLLLFKLSVQEVHFTRGCVIQSHTPNWCREGRRVQTAPSACRPMSADSNVLPFAVWRLESKRMRKPPAVSYWLIPQRMVARAWPLSPPTAKVTRIRLVFAPINHLATINRAINSYCHTDIQ